MLDVAKAVVINFGAIAATLGLSALFVWVIGCCFSLTRLALAKIEAIFWQK